MSYSATAGLGVEPSEERTRARALYAEAEQLYNGGDFSGAAKMFHQAYETFPLPTVLVSIAMSYREMGEMGRARQWAQRYLLADPSGPLSERASKIKEDADRAIQAASTVSPEAPRDAAPQRAVPLPTTADAYPERATKAVWVIGGMGVLGILGMGWYLTRPKKVRRNRRRRTSRRR